MLPTFRPAGSKIPWDKNEESNDCGKNRRYQNRPGGGILCSQAAVVSPGDTRSIQASMAVLTILQAQHHSEENHEDHQFSHADVQDAAGTDDKRHKPQMNLDVALSADAGPDALEGISEAFI